MQQSLWFRHLFSPSLHCLHWCVFCVCTSVMHLECQPPTVMHLGHIPWPCTCRSSQAHTCSDQRDAVHGRFCRRWWCVPPLRATACVPLPACHCLRATACEQCRAPLSGRVHTGGGAAQPRVPLPFQGPSALWETLRDRAQKRSKYPGLEEGGEWEGELAEQLQCTGARPDDPLQRCQLQLVLQL